MNTRKVAAALNTISVAFGELAEALIEQPGQETEVTRGTGAVPSMDPVPVPRPAPSYPPGAASADYPGPLDTAPFYAPDESSLLDEIFPEDVKAAPRGEAPQGSLAVCPKHKAAFLKGRFGDYCPSRSDDPAWANKKGYCTITPKNAHIWLQAQAAIA